MTHSWQDFLSARGARIDAQGLVRFGSPDTTQGCRLFALDHLGLIAVSGDDAREFLQGQLTNDIRELSPTHTQLSAQCSQKGRILAVFRVIALDDAILLQLPMALIEDSIAGLRKYVLRSKLSLETRNDWAAIGVTGDSAAALLTAQGLSAPEHADGLAVNGELAVVRVPSEQSRFMLLGPETALRGCWDTLAEQARPADTRDWIRLDIQAGLPQVYPSTREAFIPQMLNLQLLDGVSFTKGCYTGQEVVARMQHLGTLKRRMYRATLNAPSVPQPGDELFSPESTSRQASGRIVEAVSLDDGRYEVLATVEISVAESGEVRLGEDGPVLSLQVPPYGFG